VLLAAAGGLLEALALRGALDLGQILGAPRQRWLAGAALLLFLGGQLGLELRLLHGLQRLGRALETRLRVAFQTKVPRLGDRFLTSRPLSDMAGRCHSVQQLRTAPSLAAQLLRNLAELAVTCAGLVWLEPRCAPLVLLVAAVSVALPLLSLQLTSEQDLRARNHAGALGSVTLDALQGLAAVRAHGGERLLRAEHEARLVDWLSAVGDLRSVSLLLDGAVYLAGSAGAVLLFLFHLGQPGGAGAALLFLYWALTLPAQGQELAALSRRIPEQRNCALRLIEPLGATQEGQGPQPAAVAAEPAAPAGGVALQLRDLSVHAGGHPVLQQLSLEIAAGSEVAVVGPSGAGKSSLLGLLLGWHRPSGGAVTVDGAPLDVTRLRPQTAWVDPAVQLWSGTLFDNLRYGSEGAPPLQGVLEAAELVDLLERLPDGLQTELGEGGGLLSGGEGQRVRLARAMLRRKARLVLLDEPFRGLDRVRRARLLQAARAWWRGATLLCVTHDVGETLAFPRVLVVEGGRVVEDGVPALLAARPGSRYGALLAAERELQALLWADPSLRRLRLEDGRLVEGGQAA
jgi:ATP-binding cassette subfamily B protein